MFCWPKECLERAKNIQDFAERKIRTFLRTSFDLSSEKLKAFEGCVEVKIGIFIISFFFKNTLQIKNIFWLIF